MEHHDNCIDMSIVKQIKSANWYYILGNHNEHIIGFNDASKAINKSPLSISRFEC